MPKDYLTFENQRNRDHAALYVELIKRAYGEGNDCLIGHHLTFEQKGDLQTENEIPSADSLLFCPEAMGAIFGDGAHAIMRDLAVLAPGDRERYVADALAVLDTAKALT